MEKASSQQPDNSSVSQSFSNNHSRSFASTSALSFSHPQEISKIDSSTLIQMKQKLYPSFFSEKGLVHDILEVTQAEPDVPLNTFIALKAPMENLIKSQKKKSLEDSWKNFLGTNSIKGILHSPEYLLGDQDVFQLRSKLSKEEDEIFKFFKQVIKNIDDLGDHVAGLDIFEEKEMILKLLGDVKSFYNDYRTKILAVCKEDDPSAFSILSDLIRPKAIMFGEMLSNGPAYRISKDIARHILSLDHHGNPLEKKPDSNHRVSFLPKNKAQVFFKADGGPNLKPGNEAMLYSLYKLLSIPVPQTALLVIAGIKENDSSFYIAQASEAVLGESPNAVISSKEKLEPQTNDFASFCKQTVGAILTSPVDGKSANFIYSQNNHGLISIDNDEIFHQSFSETWNKKGYLIQTKSLLFCLQAMDQPITRSFSSFLRTLDHQLLLLAWLDELRNKNGEYANLEYVLRFENARQKFQKTLPHKEFPHLDQLLEDPREFYSLHNHSFKDLCLPITLSNELLNSLQSKFSIITQVLSDDHCATLQELLEKTSPCVGAFYKKLREKFKNPLEAIDTIFAIDGPSSQASFVSDLINTSSIHLEIQSSESNDSTSPTELFSSLYQSLEKENSYFLDEAVKKYGKRRKEGLLQPEETLKELFHLVNMKLAVFQDVENLVDFWDKGRREIKNNTNIIEQWDSLFFSLNHPELRWRFGLEKYFSRGWKNYEGEYPKELSDVKGAFSGKRCLSEAMSSQIFDESGAFKKEESLTGRSQVAKFPKESPIFYLKKSPEIPGYEYAATLFMRSLGLESIPFSELFLFQNPKQGLYSVLLSQAVQGDTLDTIWQDDKNFTSLDPHHTYLLILCSILLNPEDGKGDNYVLTPDKRRIIPIDNDHVFLPGTIQEEKGFFFKTIITELQSKTVLFCLHEMNKPIPSSVTQIFAQLDIDKFLSNWLKKLVKVNDYYQNLPPQDLVRKEGNKGTFFRIAFPLGYIKNLYYKLDQMKELLSKPIQCTPFEILKSLEPYVGKLYWDVFQQESSVEKRFLTVTNPLYKKNRNRQVSKINSIQIFKILDIPRSELMDEIFLRKMGPQESLDELALVEKHINKKKNSYQSLLQGKTKPNPVDASKYSADEDKVVLNILLKQNREVLAYHNSQHLSADNLHFILSTLPPLNSCHKIKFLDLRGAKTLNRICFKFLSDFFPVLEYLNLSENPLLEFVVFLNEDFKNLKRLVLSRCPNLIGVIIESSLLDVLEINNNEKLIIGGFDLPNLTYLELTGTRIHRAFFWPNFMGKDQIDNPAFETEENLFNIEKKSNQIIAVLSNGASAEQLNETQEFLNEMRNILDRIEVANVEERQDIICNILREEDDRMDKRMEKIVERLNFLRLLNLLRERMNFIERPISFEDSLKWQESILDDMEKFYKQSFKISGKIKLALQEIEKLKSQREQLKNKVEEVCAQTEHINDYLQITFRRMIDLGFITLHKGDSGPNPDQNATV